MERVIRIFLLLTQIASEVLRKFLHHKIQPLDLKGFLTQEKHKIYHLWNVRRCCTCRLPLNIPTRQILTRNQFDSLFTKHGLRCANSSQNCSCEYAVDPNVQLTDIDITLCVCLSVNCFNLPQQEKDLLNDLRAVRNEIAHYKRDTDFTDVEFFTLWTQVKNALVAMTGSFDQTYVNPLKEQIRIMKHKLILPADQSCILKEIAKWKKENEEKHELLTRRLEQLEQRFDNLELENDMLDNTTRSRRRFLGETSPKTVDDCSVPFIPPHHNILHDIESMRQKGAEDIKDGLTYCLLVYIGLRGSTQEENVQDETLEKIYRETFKSSVPENVDLATSVSDCLGILLEKYIDQIGDDFTLHNSITLQAVLLSFGRTSFGCLVELCSLDILLDYIQPTGLAITGFPGNQYIFELVSALMWRFFQINAGDVGQYLKKLAVEMNETETPDLFLNTLNTGKENITANAMISFLDGLTCNATNFKIFYKCKLLNDTVSQSVDKFSNTVFHYMVALFLQSEKFEKYIAFFSEKRPVFFHIGNDDGHTAVHFAACLGRYSVIAYSMCSDNYSEARVNDILLMVKHGIDSLQRLNSSQSKVSIYIRIDLDEVNLGGQSDYEEILKIIGINSTLEETTEQQEDVQEETENIAQESTSPACEGEDLSRIVGDKIVSLVTDIKKGLEAFTRIPDAVKTIHQATKLND